jgi:hypothetical protein
MSEQTMRNRVVKALKPLDARSVENRVGPGTPDVNYIGGWVELKWMKRWPKNADTSPVLLDHFTPQQRAWLRLRWKRGGRAYLLLQVGKEWLLFEGPWAAANLGRVTRPELRKGAIGSWMNGLKAQELTALFSGASESSKS